MLKVNDCVIASVLAKSHGDNERGVVLFIGLHSATVLQKAIFDKGKCSRRKVNCRSTYISKADNVLRKLLNPKSPTM